MQHQSAGINAVMHLLTHRPDRIRKIAIDKKKSDQPRIKALLHAAREADISIEFWNADTIEKTAMHEEHQGVLAEMMPPKLLTQADLPNLIEDAKKPALVLALDGVTDPHNLGACLRSADAAGVDFVLLPKDNSASINPTVRKVSSGSADTVPCVTVTNLVRALKTLQDAQFWVYGLDVNDASVGLYNTTFSGNVVIVMGAEGKGLRELTKTACDYLVHIPMRGSVESLNVSVATGVVLFEVNRQLLQK